MRYWWVNQKQTYRHEVPGGYLWSPKRKSNGDANPFYDFMREVAPNDVVFSFAGSFVRAIGRVGSYAYEAPKPLEFGGAGAHWDQIGWRVDVLFTELRMQIRPQDHMAVLAQHLPHRYAPLRSNGLGLQSVYLTLLPDSFAGALIDLLGGEAHSLVHGFIAEEPRQLAASTVGQVEWEAHVIAVVQKDIQIPDTVRQSIMQARRGQGLFKERVLRLERACRITGVDRLEHLRASHCKPWRDSTNEERLDGENGLLLTPNADHLFDRGFIAFSDTGDVLVSPVAHPESLFKMGFDVRRLRNVGRFSEGQRRYLDYHRENVLLRSRFLEAT